VRSRPIRRLTGAAVGVALTLALLTLAAVPAVAFDRATGQKVVLRLINDARADRGLHALRSCAALSGAARAHSVDMIRHDYFAHSSLSGAGVGRRARRAGYGVSGCSQWSVGEVIAWGSGVRGGPRAVFKAWMHSAPHRSIILGRRWRDIGVGCARGTFQGIRGVVMYTVDVGRRAQ